MPRKALYRMLSILSICLICGFIQNCSNEEVGNANTDIDEDTVLNGGLPLRKQCVWKVWSQLPNASPDQGFAYPERR